MYVMFYHLLLRIASMISRVCFISHLSHALRQEWSVKLQTFGVYKCIRAFS